MAASLLDYEPPATNPETAASLANASIRSEPSTLLDEFDDHIAASVVAECRNQHSTWTVRMTGRVVLDAVESLDLMTSEGFPAPMRHLVARAHHIARQIVPPSRWSDD